MKDIIAKIRKKLAELEDLKHELEQLLNSLEDIKD